MGRSRIRFLGSGTVWAVSGYLLMSAPSGCGGGSGGSKDGGSDASKDVESSLDAKGSEVAVPTSLMATLFDRRQTSVQLVWPAPEASGGGTVAGYDIRVANVPITATNFDDTSVTLSVSYTGVPAAPGHADELVVKNLNIEQAYYFAVAGTDANGTRGTIMATATAVQAEFMTTVLAGAGTDGIGEDMDGSGDFGSASDLGFTPDGFSDLIVGGSGGMNVYVYFGTSSGYASTPSITITGTTANFGQAVVNAGDLDGDGLNDIAIASPNEGGGGTVYIFSRKNPPASWGTTNSWPPMLTGSQANYIFTADATYAGGTGSIQPAGMARLGNFDGSGADDLAIGFAIHDSKIGSLLIVKGTSSLASMTIPDPAGTKTVEIDGTVAGGYFGILTVGIGQFFPLPAGSGLVTSAAGASDIYAFKGQSPSGVLTATGADDSVIGPVADLYGFTLGFLGTLGASPGAVTIGAPSASPAYVDVNLGTAGGGPLLGPAGGAPAPTVRFKDTAAGNSFGVVNFGGGVKGTSQTVSFIGGDTVSDLILAGQAEAGTPIYIVNGAAISSLPAAVDLSAAQTAVVPPIVKVANHFPSGWGGYGGASLIVDSNKDGYADFAIGEYAFGKAGRVVVFY
jgi:hypothetical protein